MGVRKLWHLWRGKEHIETAGSRAEAFYLLGEYRMADPSGEYRLTHGWKGETYA